MLLIARFGAGAQAVVNEKVELDSLSRKLNIFLIFFVYGVEFRHSTRNASEIQRKMGNGNVLIGT